MLNRIKQYLPYLIVVGVRLLLAVAAFTVLRYVIPKNLTLADIVVGTCAIYIALNTPIVFVQQWGPGSSKTQRQAPQTLEQLRHMQQQEYERGQG